MKKKESDTLLKFLYEHSREEEYLVRFKWRKHSVAFWDNRGTQHRGILDFGKAYRLMPRVSIADNVRPA